MMISKNYRTMEEALVQMKKLGELDSASGEGQFRSKVSNHLKTDYAGRKGALVALARFGKEAATFRAVPFVSINCTVDTDSSDGVDYEMMVGYLTPDGVECLDSSEALGYNHYIKQAAHAVGRKEQIKATNLKTMRAAR